MVKRWKASTIVEMAYLMPVILFMWMLVIFALFYYHDKNILAGAAYETAVVGSELAHEETEISEEMLTEYFQERIHGKLLFFGRASVEVQGGQEEVHVKATASSKGLKLDIGRSAAVTIPEEEIRKKKAIIERIEGEME